MDNQEPNHREFALSHWGLPISARHAGAMLVITSVLGYLFLYQLDVPQEWMKIGVGILCVVLIGLMHTHMHAAEHGRVLSPIIYEAGRWTFPRCLFKDQKERWLEDGDITQVIFWQTKQKGGGEVTTSISFLSEREVPIKINWLEARVVDIERAVIDVGYPVDHQRSPLQKRVTIFALLSGLLAIGFAAFLNFKNYSTS